MATITTNTYLDGGTARTAGETWTLNSGAKFTIRTDTRWHANAPASMTGSLGTVTLNSPGCQFYVDGTKVRWMPYNSGTGNVPAIGTTITQGGVSGYLLGVWSTITAAPTAVGSAMPATGFIKFREVTGGTYSAGALTGIGASATDADVTGWIEVVFDQSAIINPNINSLPTTMIGDWFYLGTTSGTAGQTIELPMNGGGANTNFNGVQIETAVGSGVYEWWPAIISASMTVANIATDQYRGKMVRSVPGTGLIIGTGSDGTAGYTPVAGLRIRTPNIFLRQCTTAARASNAAPGTTATRPQWCATAGSLGGNLYLRNVTWDWNLNLRSARKFDIEKCSFDTFFTTTEYVEEASRCVNSCMSYLASSTSPFTSLADNTEFSNNVFASVAGSALTFTSCYNIGINNNKFIGVGSTGSNNYLALTYCGNFTINNNSFIGGGINLTSSTNISMNTFDYISCSGGTTNATRTGTAVLSLTYVKDSTFNNLTFGSNGQTLPSCRYNSPVLSITSCDNANLKFTNFGTRTSPLVTDATYAPTYLALISGICSGIEFDRIYFSKLLTGTFNGFTRASNDIRLKNCSIVGASSFLMALTNDSYCKGMLGGYTLTSSTASPGLQSFDSFDSTYTTGYSIYSFFKPSNTVTSSFLYSSGANTAYYTSGQGAYLTALNDYAICEQLYFAKGHTSLQNAAITFAGANQANMSFQYQIDTGSGWNGTWKTCNGTNFAAETLDPTVGFKIKLKVTCTTAAAGNYVSTVKIATNCTASSIDNNLYPLVTATLGFTGLVTGSEVRVYTGSDPSSSVEIGGIESTSGSTFSLSQSNSGQTGYIVILAMGYQPIYLPYTFKSVDETLLIQQVIDRNYTNPA